MVDYSIGKAFRRRVRCGQDGPSPPQRTSGRPENRQRPYFTFHRPYHLTSLEVPLTVARVVLHGKTDMVPLPKPVAEVCAVAKRTCSPASIWTLSANIATAHGS
ncbi:hypothetical protein [Brucella sp. 09RB8910]|uniref:hypothetical protein n=1 Tax=Brucella sp. 09RB8910 TaxID=1844051 RepID=UPI00352DD5CC